MALTLLLGSTSTIGHPFIETRLGNLLLSPSFRYHVTASNLNFNKHLQHTFLTPNKNVSTIKLGQYLLEQINDEPLKNYLVVKVVQTHFSSLEKLLLFF
jgi:hypothetical protein